MKKLFESFNVSSQNLVFYYNRRKCFADIFSRKFKNFGRDNGITGIYKIPCKNCKQNYIGETGRPFSIRLSEHQKFSGSVGHYASFDHKKNFGHDLDYDNSKILYSESNLHHRKIIESLFMKEFDLFDNNSSSYNLEVF